MKPKDPSELPSWHEVTNHGAGRGVFVQHGLNVSKPIYRYMAAADLRTTLQTSQFYMSNVLRWPDPYEQWWCNELFRNGSKLEGVNAYGSCWTRRSKDEPFWRLYQDRCNHKNDQGEALLSAPPPVRLKVGVSKIVSLLSDEVRRVEAKAYIGSVIYCRTEAIKAKAAALRATSKEVAADAAAALHMKRYAFWFESEVRILWIDRQGNRDARTFSFCPVDFIDSVMIGPTLDIAAGKRLKTEIVEMGIPAERIKRSLIYSGPASRRAEGSCSAGEPSSL